MRIGYACIAVGSKYRTNRKLMLKNFNKEDFIKITKENLSGLYEILKYNVSENIEMFRISSDIIPLGSHEINTINWKEYFKDELKLIGEYIRENHIRVSMHPGQYTIINSPNEEIVEKSIKDLAYHCDFLDALNVDTTCKVVLHIGGVYGNKEEAIERFIRNYHKLDDVIKKRLVIENDERCFNIDELLYISSKTYAPVIFDNLHNKCNEGTMTSEREILEKVAKTWSVEDGTPKIHYSQQSSKGKKGAHSQTIYVDEFLDFYEDVKDLGIDIMLEVKDKEISVIKCSRILNEINSIKNKTLTTQWAKYKYVTMEKNYRFYKEVSGMVKEKCKDIEFYRRIDEILKEDFHEGAFINTAEHIWGYFKEVATDREKNHFFKLINGELKDKVRCKDYLLKLAIKYDEKYILESYYFTY